MDTIYLTAAAEENDINLDDKMAINTFLKRRITEMIRDAKKEFEERNADAEGPVEPMLPLIRLRVDTTGVPEMTNPQRLGLEFQQKIANPRDVLQFIRTKARTTKNVINQPDLDIDQPEPGGPEKVKIRVGQLVQEYLSAQDMQLLESRGMNDAIETYVDKDDTHAIVSYVKASEKHMRQALPQLGDLDTNGLDELLANAREKIEQEHEEEQDDVRPGKTKGKGKVNAEEDAHSIDSMAMDEDLDLLSDEAPKKAAPKRATTKKATPVPKAAPKSRATATKTAASKGKGKAKQSIIDSDEEIEDFDEQIMNIDEEEEEEEEEVPTAKKGRAKAAPTKSAPARKTPAPRGKKATQTPISFAPSRSKTAKTIELSDSD
ncbi:meiotic recombination [Serendipita sp. 399]|nr:meiotic recombination [Serendipita sp. 399]